MPMNTPSRFRDRRRAHRFLIFCDPQAARTRENFSMNLVSRACAKRLRAKVATAFDGAPRPIQAAVLAIKAEFWNGVDRDGWSLRQLERQAEVLGLTP
jgi:hypothetical protein